MAALLALDDGQPSDAVLHLLQDLMMGTSSMSDGSRKIRNPAALEASTPSYTPIATSPPKGSTAGVNGPTRDDGQRSVFFWGGGYISSNYVYYKTSG